MKSLSVFVILSATISIAAFPAIAQNAPNTCVAETEKKIETMKSMVVTDRSIVTEQRFGLAKTLGAILRSRGVPDTAKNRSDFLQSLLNTMTNKLHKNGAVEMEVQVRAEATQLTAEKLLKDEPGSNDFMTPLGLFNRMDLMDGTLTHCGEHRIVYGFRQAASPVRRFFLIFEAKLPNPAPASGFEGCRPVAEFWRKQSELTPAESAGRLEEFYYLGLTLPGGKKVEPVVKADHYGVLGGQVRSNMFIQFPWQLREWQIEPSVAGQPFKFRENPIGNNPLTELYDSKPLANPALTALRQEYQQVFATRIVKDLLDTDTAFAPKPGDNVASAFEAFKRSIVNGVGADTGSKFNEFQGNSHTEAADDPSTLQLSAAFRTAIDAARNGDPTVTVDNVMQRATAITCAGCHQLSADKTIKTVSHPNLPSGAINWPGPAEGGFVHITEPRNNAGKIEAELSPALKEFFLPGRKTMLAEKLCIPAPQPGKPTPPVVVSQKPGQPATQPDYKQLSDLQKRITDVSAQLKRTNMNVTVQDALKFQQESLSKDLRTLEQSQRDLFGGMRRVH